ncbi:hypothetical protein [Pseudomonas indica]|uniref:hypothetical protein n=1 Tax=Pseudomonas indica TaxID=137658 RepID=UPI000BABF781|nr:hypothetical protein [Pseudomonas indica]PAU65222.1 hypothetical protein BZL42_00600 [Pseudomonas indica]
MQVGNQPPHLAITLHDSAPLTPAPSGPQTKGEKINSWLGSAGQQAIVSGVAWGFANKLAPAVGKKVGESIAGPEGATAGVAIGNLIGGACLGIAHYSAEVACTKLRTKLGHGFQYQPDINGAKGKKFTYNTFIATFSSVGALKGLVKEKLGIGKGWGDVFKGVGLDVASSAIGGGIAQSIINLRKPLVGGGGFHGELKYKEIKDGPYNWREAKNRIAGGTVAGASGAMLDAVTEMSNPKGGFKVATSMVMGGAKSWMMLHTWFNARETVGAMFPKPPAATPTPPEAPTAPPPPAPPTQEHVAPPEGSTLEIELTSQTGESSHIPTPSLLKDTVESQRYYGGEQSEIVAEHSGANEDEKTPFSSKRHNTGTLESVFNQSSRGWERSRP